MTPQSIVTSRDNNDTKVWARQFSNTKSHLFSKSCYYHIRANRTAVLKTKPTTFKPNRRSRSNRDLNRIAIGICPPLRCPEPKSTEWRAFNYISCSNWRSTRQWCESDTISQSINQSIETNYYTAAACHLHVVSWLLFSNADVEDNEPDAHNQCMSIPSL